MELTKAIEVLTNFVKTDRIMRDYNDTSDYEQISEERCIAIEVVLEQVRNMNDDLKIGDKVKIYPQTHARIHDNAREHIGEIMTIKEVSKVAGYKMEEDTNNLIWDESMFTKI